MNLHGNSILLKFMILVSIFFNNKICYGQKSIITDTTYQNWPIIASGHTKLSPDGKFFYYRINNDPVGKTTLVIASTDNSWFTRFISVSSYDLTADAKFIFLKQGDTLKQVDLKTKKTSFVAHCDNYQLCHNGKKEWLIYQLKNDKKTLIVKDLLSNKLRQYFGINNYKIDSKAEALILISKKRDGSEVMRWLDLNTDGIDEIYLGAQTDGLIFDNSGKKMIFYTVIDGRTSIWSYERGQKAAVAIADEASEGIKAGHRIAKNIWKLSADGENLFFTQEFNRDIKDGEENPDLKIWSYQDAFLRSQYNSSQGDDGDRNLSVLNIKSRKIRQLLTGIQKIKNADSHNSDVFIVESAFARAEETSFNIYAQPSYYLLFTETGELRVIKEASKSEISILELSPDNNYLIYFDPELRKYCSYNLNNKQTITINGIEGGLNFNDEFRRNLDINRFAAGIVAWIGFSSHVIIQGTFDLWDVDVSGQRPPVNLTKIGAIDRTIFTLMGKPTSKQLMEKNVLVVGYKLKDKSNILCSLNLEKGILRQLYTNSRSYSRPYGGIPVFYPSKNGYLIAEQSANSSLNYKFTKDFKKFVQLTENYPERAYTWLTAELVTYKDIVGKPCEGILYKPENFDSSQKYPVLFKYYMDESSTFNDFPGPEPSSSGFNIPLLVSRGYLIFKPNIYQVQGQPGESALTSVLAGADYLSRQGWVDSTKMGISGHSFGGYETNYIVTHTNRFKAVYSGAGTTNLIEAYNELANGTSKQWTVRAGYYSMVEGLEKGVGPYITNSPIVFAKNICTPLLLMHNDNDQSVPVTHSIQFFNQLRSLNKPVWLLQYDNELHTLDKPNNRLDLQKRVQSFFDYYLKDAPKPSWMTKHISPNSK